MRVCVYGTRSIVVREIGHLARPRQMHPCQTANSVAIQTTSRVYVYTVGRQAGGKREGGEREKESLPECPARQSCRRQFRTRPARNQLRSRSEDRREAPGSQTDDRIIKTNQFQSLSCTCSLQNRQGVVGAYYTKRALVLRNHHTVKWSTTGIY